MQRLTQAILEHVTSLPEGASVSAKALLHLGSRAAVDQALSRLVRRGQLIRAGRGLYVRPVESRFGKRPPSVEHVVRALAAATEEVIASHGAAAANALGMLILTPGFLILRETVDQLQKAPLSKSGLVALGVLILASLAALGDNPDELPRLTQHFEKRLRRIPSSTSLEYSVPLHRLYVIEVGESLAIEPLPPAEAVYHLVQQSHAARLEGVLASSMGRHLRQCSALAETVPVRRLVRTTSLNDLSDLVSLVERDASDAD